MRAVPCAGYEGGQYDWRGAIADYRFGGRIFGTLVSEAQGYGNLVRTPEVRAIFVDAAAGVFVRIAGGG